MNVVIGADHNGVVLKSVVKGQIKALGHNVIDIGSFVSVESVDYNVFAHQVGKIVANGDAKRGVLICGTGQGMCIAANKIHGVRASLVHNLATAALAREHNRANVLCLGAWITPQSEITQIVDSWFRTGYGQKRHVKRVEMLEPERKTGIVLANGVFDIIHSGHIALLNFAKRLGERLVVAINSDAATKELKGIDRPVNKERDRMKILMSIRAVDEVVIFNSVTVDELIKTLKPSVIVKGDEWTEAEVRKRDKIPEHIKVVLYPLKPNCSSTSVIESIRKKGCGGACSCS